MSVSISADTLLRSGDDAPEAADVSKTRADERFVEHELVESLFEKLSRARPGTLEWNARLNVARELIARHIDKEHEDMFEQLGRRFEAAQLREMGRRFELARDKLTLLEDAKAA